MRPKTAALKWKFGIIVNDYAQKIATLIKEAIESGVCVDILVHDYKKEADSAWKYFEELGFSKDSNLIDVLPYGASYYYRDHLQIGFDDTMAQCYLKAD